MYLLHKSSLAPAPPFLLTYHGLQLTNWQKKMQIFPKLKIWWKHIVMLWHIFKWYVSAQSSVIVISLCHLPVGPEIEALLAFES